MFVKITFFSIFFPHEVVVAAKKKKAAVFIKVVFGLCKYL